jgi:hypothetical protein
VTRAISRGRLAGLQAGVAGWENASQGGGGVGDYGG